MNGPITDLETAVRELGALPMPVGPEPQASPADADRAKAPWGRGEDGRPLLPMGAHWTDIPELVDRHLAGIQARVDQAQPGHWYVAPATETWRAPGTVCTRVDGYQRTVGQCTNMLPADLELVLHAHDDLSWCLDVIAKLRARVDEVERKYSFDTAELRRQLESARVDGQRLIRAEQRRAELEAVLGSHRKDDQAEIERLRTRVAELERERHSTNEALDDAVQELRARRDAGSVERSADRLTRLLAPTQALREDPHDSPLHHPYRLGRDLPQMGGA